MLWLWKQPIIRRLLLVGLGVCGVIYVVGAAQVIRVADRQWFDPAPESYGDWNPPDLEFEDVWFEASDGTRLNGWYVPHENPQAIVLFLHGSSANISYRADRLRELKEQLQSTVFTFDYRGFGRSEGEITEDGLIADTIAAREWLAERAGVQPSDVVLLGRSLGAILAAKVAASGARMLAIEGGGISLKKVATAQYRWLPIAWFMEFELSAAEEIAEYHGPLVQIHGTEDTVVPLRLARELFMAAGGPKQFIAVPGAGHEDPPPPEFYDALRRWLAQTE